MVRYKILSYYELQDNKNLARQLRSLLKYDTLRSSDMILARELLVYENLLRSTPYEALLEDRKLLENYTSVCYESVLDPHVCDLGSLAQQALNKDYSFSSNHIKDLLALFPKSYLYYVLGDFYVTQGNLKDAQKAFVSALSLTSDQASKQRITTKIKELF